jgi:hypothetical protein
MKGTRCAKPNSARTPSNKHTLPGKEVLFEACGNFFHD